MNQPPPRATAAPSPADDHDAVRILDHLVRRAVETGASDIHVEPRKAGLSVRFRIDGVMTDQGALPLELGPLLATRVKVLGRMDMTVRMLPQDGQFTIDLPGGRPVNLRASTFPAIHGEKIVMRVLLGHQIIALDKLGMGDAELYTTRRLVSLTSGLIVLCGPTGSGKTSTLYSMVGELDTSRLNVITLEDPIEIELSTVTQGQTNPRAGFTFASGLRATLRQDPDVILVGEIRDAETIEIALQASLTGHLVFSTLHTSHVVETISRIIDLGAEPWIVGNALQAVIAQRLVRKLCDCFETYRLPHDLTASFEDDRVVLTAGTEVRRARGCTTCHKTGYRGRIGLFEVLELDDELRDLVKGRAAAREYKEAINRRSIRRLREAGLERVAAGETSLEEVVRVT